MAVIALVLDSAGSHNHSVTMVVKIHLHIKRCRRGESGLDKREAYVDP